MNLGKPPVVEVSVDFQFESSPSDSEWAFARAVEFVEQFQADYAASETALPTVVGLCSSRGRKRSDVMLAFDADLLTIPALVSGERPSLSGGFGLSRRAAVDPWSKMVQEITVGEATYRLRQPLTLTFYPYVSGDEGELVIEPGETGSVRLSIIGRGRSFEEAYSNWAERFHTEVQSLLAKRPWELSAAEAEAMAAIESLIDLPAHHRDTPYRVRQIGEVTRRRPLPDRIRWEDGQLDHVSLAQMPVEFAAMHAGDRFEAIVLRAPGSGKLIRVVFVSPLPRLPHAPCDPADWEAFPKTTQEPRVSWDELK